MDVTISNITLSEHPSGLVRRVEADFRVGRGRAVRVGASFVNLPIVDANGDLDMTGVGSMLMSNYQSALNPRPEPESVPDLDAPEVVEVEPTEPDPELVARRREEFEAIQERFNTMNKTKTVEIGDTLEDVRRVER